jgi:hypothetical protein
MEDIELKEIWMEYDRKLEASRVLNLQSWALNLHCFETLQSQKVKSKLNGLAAFKTRAVVLGIVWVLFLGLLVYANQFRNMYFAVSLSAIMLVNIIIMAWYIYHIVLIRQINYTESIMDTQQKLSQLQLSTFRGLRIAWLQLPFHTTWFWHSKWIIYSSLKFWLIPFPITLCFVLLTIYLYRNLRIENMHKKWVRILMMAGPEYKSVVKAMEFMDELEEFKKD